MEDPINGEQQSNKGRSTYTDFTLTLQELREIVIRNELSTQSAVERIEASVNGLAKVVSEHERALYQQNGSPDALDILEDIAEADQERKKVASKRADEMLKGDTAWSPQLSSRRRYRPTPTGCNLITSAEIRRHLSQEWGLLISSILPRPCSPR